MRGIVGALVGIATTVVLTLLVLFVIRQIGPARRIAGLKAPDNPVVPAIAA